MARNDSAKRAKPVILSHTHIYSHAKDVLYMYPLLTDNTRTYSVHRSSSSSSTSLCFFFQLV